MKKLISLQDYTNGRDLSYPDEWTEQTKKNAEKLLERVNNLLEELGTKKAKVSSGFRPSAINNVITNAAKKSYHTRGLAVDIVDDKDQTLGKLIASRPDLLKKYELWLEDLNSTRGKNTNWIHLDLGVRSERPSRVFKP